MFLTLCTLIHAVLYVCVFVCLCALTVTVGVINLTLARALGKVCGVVVTFFVLGVFSSSSSSEEESSFLLLPFIPALQKQYCYHPH